MAHPSNQNNNRKKYEIATDEVGNPIKQDEKKGKLREFKKGDIFFNYGCLPVSYYIPYSFVSTAHVVLHLLLKKRESK